MRRLLATTLLAAFALLGSTFAGMTVFGMHDGADAAAVSCVGMHCAPMSGAGTNDFGCINDCLSSATALTSAVLPMPPAFVPLLALCALLLSEIVDLPASFTRRTFRWREGIGKVFLRQSLSTVILRN